MRPEPAKLLMLETNTNLPALNQSKYWKQITTLSSLHLAFETMIAHTVIKTRHFCNHLN